MFFLIYLAILPLSYQPDPAPGLLHSKQWSRNLECARVSAEAGNQRYPGQVEAAGPRGDYFERSVMICKERMMRLGIRPARDEAILTSLDERTIDLANLVQSLRPDLAERTWLVETHYPSPQVAAKIEFATKTALVGQGLAVSDRTPLLGAGDIDVITRMAPSQAYAAACQRYVDTGNLGEGDALLAVIDRDPRETILHAGICADGRWTWLK